MNPLLMVLLGWLAVGLEMGLKPVLSVRVGSLVAGPSFVVPLAAMVALCAPPQQALWACMALGVALDLTSPRDGLTIVGPYGIGMVLACQLVLALRGLVIRRNPLTLMVVSVLACLVCQVWVTAVMTARRVVDADLVWSSTHELVERGLGAVLTAGTALVLSLVLLPMAPLLGLAGGHGKGGLWR